ncbi:MAG: TonB-dependent receptor domain-containing protein, partial [Blastocatellia bacterium]
MSRNSVGSIALGLSIFLSTVPASGVSTLGQTVTATLVGTVSDSGGAALPGAEIFDAANFFDNFAGRAKAPLRYNQFGGTIGGPVSFSKKYFGPLAGPNGYEGRDRTFFFFNYQGTRTRRGRTGQVKTASYELAQPLVGRRNYNLGFYVQDDWKVTSRLTLNLGLRWEYESPVVEVNDIYSRVDVTTGRLLVAGRNADRTLNLKADHNNFSPRVGFAYSLNDKTVIRSAFGIFYAGIFANLGGGVNFPGFTIQQNFANLGVGLAQPFTLSQGFPLVAVRTNDPFVVERAATIDNPLAPTAQFEEISPLGRQRCKHGGTPDDAMWLLRGGTGKGGATQQPRFGDSFLTLASPKGARDCPGSGFIEPRARLNKNAEEETLARMPAGWAWDKEKTYTLRVTWSNAAGKWAVYLNDQKVFENEWQGQAQPLKYLFLGKSPDYGTFVGPYYSK